MYIKEFLIVLFYLVSLITSFYLLFISKINSTGFSLIIVALSVAAILLYNIDQVEKITTKHGEVIELRKIRDDIYAKAEMVRKMGEQVAELTAYNVTRLGRLAPDNLDEELLLARDKLNKILKDIGSDEKTINKILAMIEKMVLFDLKRNIYNSIEEETHKLMENGQQINRDEILKQVNELLKNYDRTLLIEYLKNKNLYYDDLSRLLDRVDKFIRNKKL